MNLKLIPRVIGILLIVVGVTAFLVSVYIWIWTGGSDDIAPLPWWNEPMSISGFLTAWLGSVLVTGSILRD